MTPLGFVVGLEKWVHMALIYNKIDKALKAIFKVDGVETVKVHDDITFDFTCNGIINIGRNGS